MVIRGAAGVATLGAASIEVAQNVLAHPVRLLSLVPYLDTLRWVFIAAALGGIAVTIYARLYDWKQGRRWTPPCLEGSPTAHWRGANLR
jgi:hypothetical protein